MAFYCDIFLKSPPRRVHTILQEGGIKVTFPLPLPHLLRLKKVLAFEFCIRKKKKPAKGHSKLLSHPVYYPWEANRGHRCCESQPRSCFISNSFVSFTFYFLILSSQFPFCQGRHTPGFINPVYPLFLIEL